MDTRTSEKKHSPKICDPPDGSEGRLEGQICKRVPREEAEDLKNKLRVPWELQEKIENAG